MANICANCGKKTTAGRSQTHRRGVAGKRWLHRTTKTLRVFKPNLQTYKGVTLCAKCIKRIKYNAQKAALA